MSVFLISECGKLQIVLNTSTECPLQFHNLLCYVMLCQKQNLYAFARRHQIET